MKIAFIASFPPRECGIATFTQNLMRSIGVNQHIEGSSCPPVIIAVNDPGQQYDYQPEVAFVIRQDVRDDYMEAADFINRSGAQLVVLQHEFGIYGGESGIFILSLLHRLQLPLISTFHTILKDPLYLQKVILQEIGRLAQGVVVMSRKAVAFLDNIYEIPPEKIHLIEHGVPELSPAILSPEINLLTPFAGRPVLFTFGLLNRNKGIETVIKALPKIVARYPGTVYLVLGNTHPGVKRTSGEAYRQYLSDLTDRLGLTGQVHLVSRFVSESELAFYLKSIDIYVTPYLNEAQITSGTLSYAVGAGAAVLSTPYWHAQELLAEDRGRLFDFKNSEQLAASIIGLLDEPATLRTMKDKALEYGKKMKWPRIGKKYLQLFHHTLEDHVFPSTGQKKTPLDIRALAPFDLSHIIRLTDGTGILQHAKYGIPNLREGYCIDDNARALILALMVYRRKRSPEILKQLTVYLSFIHYMQREDGLFRNFLRFNRDFADEVGSEDAFGRTIWALGVLIRYAPNSAYREMGIDIFHAAVPHFKALTHLRGIANTLIGVSQYLAYFPTDETLMALLQALSDKLSDAYNNQRAPGWHWFEPTMIYDNGILPLALLSAYEINGNHMLKQVGLESLRFLEQVCFPNPWLSPVGNKGWYTRGGPVPKFDQQAIETMAMVLAYNQAYRITGQKTFLDQMHLCYLWFRGMNDLHVPLLDQETGGCCDGLQENGLNRNQGAESTLAYWIAHLTVLKELESGEGPWLVSPPQHSKVIL